MGHALWGHEGAAGHSVEGRWWWSERCVARRAPGNRQGARQGCEAEGSRSRTAETSQSHTERHLGDHVMVLFVTQREYVSPWDLGT